MMVPRSSINYYKNTVKVLHRTKVNAFIRSLWDICIL